jgi:hypothetical protein
MESTLDFKLLLLRLFQRLLSPQPRCGGQTQPVFCQHTELVFDEINDVYCKHCRKDFTG